MRHPETDVVVVGGGLSGLTAAALLARAGRRVTVCEKASDLGGRAATHEEGEFRFNLGPHALYRGGAGMGVLGELGIEPVGRLPAAGGYAVVGEHLHGLPVGFLSLLTTGLLPLGAKLETGRLLARLGKLDCAALAGVSVADWLAAEIRRPEVRALVAALLRVSTYGNDPARQSAGAALAQVQLAARHGVLYLDGGWATLVSGLRAAAEAAGASILTGVRVAGIEHDGAVRGVRLADGRRIAASSVVVAGTAAVAAALARFSRALAEWAAAAVPVKAACLDLALSALPRPRALFALGLDAPLYFSVHSATAKLAPEGGAVIHVAKYLAPGDDGHAALAELEALANRLQPGWREQVVARRWLPGMVVASDSVTAARGGSAGRPGPLVPDLPGVVVAGDWVGAEGLLADTSLASARAAAAAVLAAEPARAAA